MKRIHNYIIPPWDPRYGKLGHLWKKYNWDNLVRSYGSHRTYFYLPPELVLCEYYSCTKVYKTYDDDEYSNWIYKRDHARVLEYCSGLSIQDLFDLLILKINNILDRPKCPICRKSIYFYSMYYGYGSPYLAWIDKPEICCSHSCSDILRWTRNDDWFNTNGRDFYRENAYYLWDSGIWNENNHQQFNELWKDPIWRTKMINNLRLRFKDPIFMTKQSMNRFIHTGDSNDICYLYLTNLKGSSEYKYGITNDINTRVITASLDGFDYINTKELYKSDRSTIAYLEASIKLQFNGKEIITESDLSKFYSLLKEFTSKPIINPFE